MMRPLPIAIVLLVVAVMAALAQPGDPAPPPGSPRPQARQQPPVVYAVVFRQGPSWAKGKPLMEQAGIMEHLDYLDERLRAGELLMAGPFLDNSGGIVLYRVKTVEEARKLVERDPAVLSGLLDYTVQPWMVAMSAEELKVREAVKE